MMYTKHSSQIHPPLCCRLSIFRNSTLPTLRRQVRIPSVHRFIRFPFPGSSVKGTLLPCWLVESKIFCNLVVIATHFNHKRVKLLVYDITQYLTIISIIHFCLFVIYIYIYIKFQLIIDQYKVLYIFAYLPQFIFHRCGTCSMRRFIYLNVTITFSFSFDLKIPTYHLYI